MAAKQKQKVRGKDVEMTSVDHATLTHVRPSPPMNNQRTNRANRQVETSGPFELSNKRQSNEKQISANNKEPEGGYLSAPRDVRESIQETRGSKREVAPYFVCHRSG